MKRPVFSEKEFDVVGKYPLFTNTMSVPASEEPMENRPISPKENLELAFSGEKPYWLPFVGWAYCDIQVFRPRVNPDHLACHTIMDGDLPYDYTTNQMKGWYDLLWDYVPQVGGATVHPGSPKVPDICEWEKYVSIPDLDAIDWERCKKANEEYCNVNKMVQLGIWCGFWERLMALMDVENAAVALIDEEQQEGVHRFFDRHTDFLIEYIDRMRKILPIDCVLIHDDWGHQNGPFFSVDTCREMIVPYLKRVVDFCHSKGIFFELHSCGRNTTNIPCMIEAGVDMWCGQPALHDFDALAEQYKHEKFVFGVTAPAVAENASEAEIREIARQWVLKHKEHHIALYRSLYVPINPVLKKNIYEFSRKVYAGEDI